MNRVFLSAHEQDLTVDHVLVSTPFALLLYLDICFIPSVSWFFLTY